MNKEDELVLHILKDGKISVEMLKDGITNIKYTKAESILECLKSSIVKDGRTDSGVLPKNCIAYSCYANGKKFVAVSFDDKTTDISFEKTEYKDFPIPRLVFGFFVSADGKIMRILMGVTELGRLTPKSKMYVFPFSNVSGFNLCTGSNTLPNIKSLHQLNGLPYYILKMPNNYDYYSDDRTRIRLDYRGLLEHLKDKDRQYYYDNVLIEMNKTLNDFISEE